MNANIKELLERKIHWKPGLETERDFRSIVDNQVCTLRMNDYPDEPLWTLIVNGQTYDFENLPRQWQVTYRSEVESLNKPLTNLQLLWMYFKTFLMILGAVTLLHLIYLVFTDFEAIRGFT